MTNLTIQYRKLTLNRRGMTLVELLVSLAILSLVIVLVGSLLVMSFRGYQRNVRQAALQQDARLKADFITGQLRAAKAVSSSALPGNTNFLLHTLPVGSERYLVMDTFAEGTPGDRRTIGTAISSLKFYDTGNTRMLGVQLTVEKQGQSYTLDFEVRLENAVVTGLGIAGRNALYFTVY